MKKKRILLLINGTDYAGAQKRILGYLEYCDFDRAEIIIVSLRDRFPKNIKQKFSQIQFKEFNFSELVTWFQWLRFLKSYHSDTIIFHETWITDFKWLAVGIAWLLCKGNVYMVEHTDFPPISIEKKKWFGLIRGIGLWKYPITIRAIFSRRILTVGKGMKEKLEKYYSYPKSKVEVAYFPLDVEKFALQEGSNFPLRHKLNIPLGDVVFVIVSRLVQEKGVHKAIIAFTNLIQEGQRNDIWLWIVGNGEKRQALEVLAQQGAARKNIIFWGHQENPETFLCESDVFLLCSEIEASGVALLEAMSSGLVCIATRTAGAEEVIQNKNFLVDHDEKSLLKALYWVINLPKEQIKDFKNAAREYIVTNFDKQKNAFRNLEILGIPSKFV